VERPGDVRDGAEKSGGVFSECRLKVIVFDHGLVQIADEIGAAVRGRFEQLQARNVHRMFTGFADEEQRIRRRNKSHRRDGTWTACAARWTEEWRSWAAPMWSWRMRGSAAAPPRPP